MNGLIQLSKSALNEKEDLPFSIYTSVKVQNILNVPIIKPLLIFVLDGEKNLGDNSEIICPKGSFVFLSNSPTINMRNIPQDHEYFAVLIDFDYEDFTSFKAPPNKAKQYCLGEIDSVLEKSLEQFIEWSLFAPKEVWSLRKRELLQTFYHLGHDVFSLAKTTSVTHRLHEMISLKMAEEVTVDDLCYQLAISDSTLRRKLKAEGTTLQKIKDQTKMGHGLHLIQTTDEAIGLIADQCGYQSQSRFTERFKQRFGLTPTALRKTKVHD